MNHNSGLSSSNYQVTTPGMAASIVHSLHCLACVNNPQLADTLYCTSHNMAWIQRSMHECWRRGRERRSSQNNHCLLVLVAEQRTVQLHGPWFHSHIEVPSRESIIFPNFLEVAWWDWRAESDVSKLRFSKDLKRRSLDQSARYRNMVWCVLAFFRSEACVNGAEAWPTQECKQISEFNWREKKLIAGETPHLIATVGR